MKFYDPRSYDDAGDEQETPSRGSEGKGTLFDLATGERRLVTGGRRTILAECLERGLAAGAEKQGADGAVGIRAGRDDDPSRGVDGGGGGDPVAHREVNPMAVAVRGALEASRAVLRSHETLGADMALMHLYRSLETILAAFGGKR